MQPAGRVICHQAEGRLCAGITAGPGCPLQSGAMERDTFKPAQPLAQAQIAQEAPEVIAKSVINRLPHKAQRLAVLAGSLLLAAAIAWVGLRYHNAAPDSTSTSGVTLTQVSSLLTEDASSPHQLGKRTDWTPQNQALSIGWTTKTLWVRLTVENSSSIDRDVWLQVVPARLRLVRMHQLEANGAWTSQTSGASVPASRRPVEISDIVLPMRLKAGEKRSVFLEINGQTIALNMSFALVDPATATGRSVNHNLADMLPIGAILALGFISLAVGLVLRQPIQLLLGLRSMAIGVWLMLQLGFLAMLLPASWVAPVANQTLWIAVFILLLTTGFLWLFLRQMPQPGGGAIAMDRWAHLGFALLLGVPLSGVALVAVKLIDSTQLAALMAPLTVALLVFSAGLSVWMIWRGQTGATVVLVTSAASLLINSQAYFTLLTWGSGGVLRQFISPIPVLVTSAFYFVGVTAQLAREQRSRETARLQVHRAAMAQLEGLVSQRTATLQLARQEADAANAAKSIFMAKVSHELRTPLHAVLGYVNLALREPLAEAVSRKLVVARRAGEQLVAHINDLLDYARVGHDLIRVEKKAFELPALLDGVAARAALMAAPRGNQLHTEFPAGVAGWWVGDSVRVEQVLMVLLSNAMHYTQRGVVTLQVQVTPQPHSQPLQDEIRFSVIDTGPGMSPEVLARIFEPFERGATDREGLGLGLPIAQHLLQLMGSQLQVSSTTGQGSVFSFALQLHRADVCEASDAQAALQAPLNPGAQRRYHGPTRRLLVLEDNAPSRQYLAELLDGLGFGVCAVADLAAAHAALADVTSPVFDLFITDQHLGGSQSGWDFIKTVRSDPAGTHHTTPVLMLSATHAQPPADWPAGIHVNLHLLKPAGHAQLVDALTQLLGVRWTDEAPAPAASPAASATVQPEDWAALQTMAQDGAVTALRGWCAQHPGLDASHPQLVLWVQQLDFERIEQYAKQRQAG